MTDSIVARDRNTTHPPWDGVLRSLLGTLLPMPDGVTFDDLLRPRGTGPGPAGA